MRMFHRLAPLSLCFVLWLGMLAPARAEEAPKVYYDPSPGFQIHLWPDDSSDWLQGSKTLYLRGGTDDDREKLYTTWNEEEFNAGMAAGVSPFQVTGSYDCSAFEIPIEIEAGSEPVCTIYIRPADLVSHLAPRWDPDPIYVTQTTGFAEARLPTVMDMIADDGEDDDGNFLYESARYDNPPEFAVQWDEEAYSAGIASLTPENPSFTVSGEYMGPVETASQDGARFAKLWADGLVEFEQQPEITVCLMEKPEEPIYFDCYDAVESCHAVVAAGTPFDQLGDAVLRERIFESWDWDGELPFLLQWDQAAYETGMASGEECFTISGEYTLQDETLRSWMEEGLIAVDEPVPPLTVHVVREDSKLLGAETVKLKERNEGIAPELFLPGLNQATSVVCAYAGPDKVWRETVLEPYRYRHFEAPDWYFIGVFDERDQLYSVDPTAPVYCKITITGSAWEGEWSYAMNEKGETPPVVDDTDDGSGGDHGGGGQGEATRPGKEKLPPIIRESLLERMRAQVAALLTFREKREAVAEPEPTGSPAAEAVLPEETAVEPAAAMESSAPTAKPAPTPKSGAAPTPAPEAAPTSAPVLAVPEQVTPAPTPSTSRPPYQGGRAIEDGGGISPPGADSPAAPPSELPGFLVALAATGAVLLAGVGYGLRRKKKP